MLKFKEREGFALITVALALSLLSIFALVLINASSSNYKMANHDSRNQSAYYIAEAGANKLVSEISRDISLASKEFDDMDLFFNYFEGKYLRKNIVFDDFEKFKSTKPKAAVELIKKDSNASSREYKIVSEGQLGINKRRISTNIEIGFIESSTKDPVSDLPGDVLMYSKNFDFQGSKISAPNGTVIIDGLQTHNLNGGASLSISNMYFNGPVTMDGGSASFGSKDNPGNIYVKGDLDFWNGRRNTYGDVRVKGNLRLKDARVHGNYYIDGDVELGWTPEINGEIYYTGKLNHPNSYPKDLLAKLKKVESLEDFTIPVVNYELKTQDWYRENGYEIKPATTEKISPSAKWLVDNYVNTNWQDLRGNIIIISKKDIILRGGNGFKGALIAPYGKVEYTGDGTFEGVIISKGDVKLTKGGSYFNLKTLKEVFGDEIPIEGIVTGGSGESNGSNSGENPNSETQIQLNIKKPIRED